jgi:hypothetical protein
MKKYLSVLVPFLACSAIALYFAFAEPNPAAIYGDRATYDWLSNLWLLIGIVTSVLTLVILLVHDAFSFWNRASEKRKLRRTSRASG